MRKVLRRSVTAFGLTLLVCACGSGGSAGSNPLAHLGPDQLFGGEVPAGAVSLSPEEFADRLADDRLTLVTLAQIQQQEEDAVAQMALDRARAEQVFAGRMEVLERHVAEPDSADPDFERLPDGSWRALVVPADPGTGRAARYASLQGRRQAYAELAGTLERYESRENQLGVYTSLYGQLDPAFRAEYELPDPSSVTQASFSELVALNLRVAQTWSSLPVPSFPYPAGHPGVAANEEGHGGIDGAAYAVHSGMWSQIDFPLKWYATSIKDQGERGTCVAHGVTAAVETILARDQARWVNLSEQMLYNRAKQKWWPSTYGDGLDMDGMLATMLVRTYQYSWERSWDYNRSPARLNLAIAYLYSCVGLGSIPSYAGEHCSESNHQATLYKVETNLGTFCAFGDPATDVLPDARLAIGIPRAIGGPGAVPVMLAKVALLLSNPVIICVTVANNMRGAAVGPDGIVHHDAVPLGSGGHCMLLLGYVANGDLPSGTPPGAGGGYFVCKNSWGGTYGDGGYCYLPDDWVAAWARGLWTLDGVVEL